MDKRKKAAMALLCMQRYSWEQGTAMQAFLESGEDEIVLKMAKEAVYRSIEDGRAAILGTLEAVTDPCSVGEALVYAVAKTQDPFLEEGLKKLVNWALKLTPRSEDGAVYHVMSEPQIWVDSFYMLPPFLAAAGYPKEAVDQIHRYWSRLYLPDKKLLGHIWDDGKKEWIRRDCWGVGNGWAMAGIARVIDLLPDSFVKEKEELAALDTGLIEAVSAYIRPDGMVHDVLDNPDTFTEVNLPQMFAYTVYRGMSSGWLNEKYLDQAGLCLSTARAHIDDYGFIQNVCGAPDFNKAGMAPEGQAFYLLLETAAENWERKSGRRL